MWKWCRTTLQMRKTLNRISGNVDWKQQKTHKDMVMTRKCTGNYTRFLLQKVFHFCTDICMFVSSAKTICKNCE